MDTVDIAVIGAGVVGLAVARALAPRGDLLVLERESHYGQGVSSRNSEVIHAGIYYPQDSLKARLCVEGKHKLYEYCESRGVPHQRCGKLIVATSDEEVEALESIKAKAEANGVPDLAWLDAAQVALTEPEVRAVRALLSPSTGIVSSHDLMTAYLGDAEAGGGMLVEQTRVTRIDVVPDGFVLHTLSAGNEFSLRCRQLVNAAGLGAQSVARAIDGLDEALVPDLHLCKGNYFSLTSGRPFSRLIYPVPEKSGAGLGVHATIDLAGQARFGPDVEYVSDEDYDVSLDREVAFEEAVRRYFPGLPEGGLSPAYTGIRPKLQGPGDAPADFVIQGPGDHGLEGLVNLFGIESPGLTSSLAIADAVAALLPR